MVLEDTKFSSQDTDALEMEALEKDSLNKQRMQEVLLSLLYGMGDSRIRAAHQIRKLTKSSAKCRAYFAAAGVIIPLVSMLKSSAMDVKEAALLALLNLAVRNERNKVRIVKAGALNPLVELMQSEDANLRESAAAAILTLSASTLNKSVIGASGSTPLLVEMLTGGSLQGKVDAVMALYNLSTLRENLVPILAAGACAPLILLLKECKKSSKVAEKIIALLEALMDFEEGRSSILKEEGGLLAIVEVLEEGSVKGREHAVGALLTMCQSNRCKYRDYILQEGVIPGLLELTVQGTSQAQEKARKLLELLRDSPSRQRAGSPASASAMLQSIAYDIAAHVDNAEAGTGSAKKMLTEMVQLSMEQSMRHLQQRARACGSADLPVAARAAKVLSK
ncbi:hypothetical protein GOP47_0029619 [Adiantum capillus-veneris]|nr:hypothetical protein GOP47_0029241 [Adiantum capillus-veneris]KAI5056098.1 hypothetical protein GOP47_0029619 [Adiantum capillus-veneris]